jgi:hypothetical protein
LTDLMILDAADVPHTVFQRVGLLRARLLEETPLGDAKVALVRRMFGEGRYEAQLRSPGNVISEAVAKGAAALTREDALSCACSWAWWAQSTGGDDSLWHRASGFASSGEFYSMWMDAEVLLSK